MTGESLDLATQRTLTDAHDATHPAVPDEPNRLAVADGLGITDEYLLDKMQDVVDKALQGVPVFDDEGNWLASVPQLPAATRALELLMKHRGMLADRTETNVSGGITISIVGVDPDTLR